MKHEAKILIVVSVLFVLIACEDTRPTTGIINGKITVSDTIDIDHFMSRGIFFRYPRAETVEVSLDDNLEFTFTDLPFGVYQIKTKYPYVLVPLQDPIVLTQDDALWTVVYGVAQINKK